ncbi:hypothetical protein BBJ29_000986 [Phytophthora kernoviae]|uniref:Uncharacterized protein n=1 Tax=Phytophthora kernoviae TaxID=325452 RepID=A0A3F2RXZ0_9STRA|nr:hypothetical protein BBJ29_000986 [Phytophthora kernoviae]RLN66448.1 hypothetical protein BBP00_00002192 [Phytophthora kernoviae]
MNRIEGLRSKLQYTNEQKKLKEEANREMHKFLEAIKPAVLLLHSRIGCSDVHSDGDMKVVLGDIEEQIVTVLQSYHAKVEAAMKEGNVPEEPIASTKLSPQGAASSSKRKASVAAMLTKQQPYRYMGLRPPHMSMEELRKKDNVEEEYPLTYHELKVKVWHNDTSQ